mgnify:CR=1 FL=1
MTKINNIPYYRCQRILPTMYDDSLSYYENLCKLTYKMNEIIDNINDEFKVLISQKIDEFFNDIMINAIYKKSEETIYLQKETIIGGDKHIFNIPNATMEII